MKRKICAGIVTFNPDINLFTQCLDSIRKQVGRTYVFDNGSRNFDLLKMVLPDDVILISSDENRGISKGLNELCKAAEKDGYSWIVTMDQDSICVDNMVEILSKHIDDSRIGIVAPRVEFRNNGELIYETRNDVSEVEEIRACITSGSLTRINAWKQIGGFDEWMFIDHVDNEFCTHLIVEGYIVIRDNKAVLYQRAGEMKFFSLLGGKKILLPYYSESRNYYICRNTVYYIRKYRKHINSKHEWMSFIYSQVIKVLFERNRIGSIRSTIKGIKDGKRKIQRDSDY